MVKTTLILMLTGALIGILVACFAVPPALSWYSTPGGLPKGAQIQALVEIPEVIRYSTGKLIFWQWVSAGIGAVAGLVVGVVFGSRGRTPGERPAPKPAPAP